MMSSFELDHARAGLVCILCSRELLLMGLEHTAQRYAASAARNVRVATAPGEAIAFVRGVARILARRPDVGLPRHLIAKAVVDGSRGSLTYPVVLQLLQLGADMGLLVSEPLPVDQRDPELVELERFLTQPAPTTETEADDRLDAARARWPDAMRRLGY